MPEDDHTFKYLYATDIAGDRNMPDDGPVPTLINTGTVAINAARDVVDVMIPIGPKYHAELRFSKSDWDRILETFNAATADVSRHLEVIR